MLGKKLSFSTVYSSFSLPALLFLNFSVRSIQSCSVLHTQHQASRSSSTVISGFTIGASPSFRLRSRLLLKPTLLMFADWLCGLFFLCDSFDRFEITWVRSSSFSRRWILIRFSSIFRVNFGFSVGRREFLAGNGRLVNLLRIDKED